MDVLEAQDVSPLILFSRNSYCNEFGVYYSHASSFILLIHISLHINDVLQFKNNVLQFKKFLKNGIILYVSIYKLIFLFNIMLLKCN